MIIANRLSTASRCHVSAAGLRLASCRHQSSMTANSNASPTQPRPSYQFTPVYVHHVSRQVLQHMQDNRSDWLEETGLDRGLHISSNGTFALHFPKEQGRSDAGRIWTSYDSANKQHWISVYRNKLKVRFLLKDHGQMTMQGRVVIHDAEAEKKNIQKGVDSLIATLRQHDS